MTATVLTPEPQMFGFNTPPDLLRELSAMPRAEVLFIVTNGVITAGGAGNQELTINMALPANFAYVCVEAYAALQVTAGPQSDLADWSDEGFLGLVDGSSVTMSVFCPGIAHVNAGAGDFKQYRFPNILQRLIEGGATQIFFLTNETVAGDSLQIEFMCRFLMYDVSQRHNVAVNTPMYSRSAY